MLRLGREHGHCFWTRNFTTSVRIPERTFRDLLFFSYSGGWFMHVKVIPPTSTTGLNESWICTCSLWIIINICQDIYIYIDEYKHIWLWLLLLLLLVVVVVVVVGGGGCCCCWWWWLLLLLLLLLLFLDFVHILNLLYDCTHLLQCSKKRDFFLASMGASDNQSEAAGLSRLVLSFSVVVYNRMCVSVVMTYPPWN